MSVKLSYAMLVNMRYDDMVLHLATYYNLNKVTIDRISTIATTSNVKNLIHNDKEVRDLCDFMETVVRKFVRKKIVGSFKDVEVECDKLHIEPFNTFFPFEIGLSRNVVTQVRFQTNEDLNRFKLKEPKLYNSLVKRCER